MNDDDLRALQEQAHQLEELTRHSGWPVLVDFLHEQMAGDKRAILNGNIDDHDKYKAVTGRLVGIHFVMDAPGLVAKAVNAELERREERRLANQELG